MVNSPVLSFFALEVPLPLDFCSSIFLIVDLGCRGFSLLGDFRLLFKLCIVSIVDGNCPSLVVLVVVVDVELVVFVATASLSFAADSPTTTDEVVGDRSLHNSCFLYSSSRVQKPPLPGSSFWRAIFLKHLFSERLCLIEFLNVTCQFGSAFLYIIHTFNTL